MLLEIVGPALIMSLVGSLVFFLIQIFYRSGFSGHVNYVMALFTFAAVLVCRVAVMEGASRAALTGIPLAAATFFVLSRFVQTPGLLFIFTPLFNALIIGVVWWCANQLVWDCTVVSRSNDVSSQGLLRGILRNGNVAPSRTADPTDQSPSADLQVSTPNRAEGESQSLVLPSATPLTKPLDWLQRWFNPPRKVNSPGKTVIYFSLAALPIFGLGQAMIDPYDSESRRYVFFLFVVYMMSGLGLLVITSLNSLLRYLTSREVKLPDAVAFSWVAAGMGMAATLLFAAWLLPRPSPEYRFVSLPVTFRSPDDIPPTRNAPGNEGRRDNKATRAGSSPDPKVDADAQSGSETQGGKSDDSDASQKGKGKGKGANDETTDSKAGSDPDNQSSNGSDGSQKTRSKSGSGGTEKGSSGGSGGASNGASERPTRAGDRPAASRSNALQSLSQALPALGNLIKLLVFLAVIIALLTAAWIYRDKLAILWHRFLTELRDLWESLFGRKWHADTAESAAPEPKRQTPQKPFQSYVDPYASGLADRMSSNQLVTYSFAALEAWGRDNHCPRAADQTPHEFARMIYQRDRSLESPVRAMADLYCQTAYARGKIDKRSTAVLKKMWDRLKTRRLPSPASSSSLAPPIRPQNELN